MKCTAGTTIGEIKLVDVLVETIQGIDPRLVPVHDILEGFQIFHLLSDEQRRAVWFIDCAERCKTKIKAAQGVARCSSAPIEETLLRDIICEMDLPPKMHTVGYIADPKSDPFCQVDDLVTPEDGSPAYLPVHKIVERYN